MTKKESGKEENHNCKGKGINIAKTTNSENNKADIKVKNH
jgi:hypothetical protein